MSCFLRDFCSIQISSPLSVSKMKSLPALLGCLLLVHLTIAEEDRDLKMFPVCINDEDCNHISIGSNETYMCFMYMCFPWETKETALQGNFRTCKHPRDCRQEGSEAEPEEDCFQHMDKRNVGLGLCVPKRIQNKCLGHTECVKTEKCVNGYCAEEKYFEALRKMPCETDKFCEVSSIFRIL